MNYQIFREKFFESGIFTTKSVLLNFPDFNTDNLLRWQKKSYIIKIRNGYYCFREFLNIPDADLLIANFIYSPSYISHQQALSWYGMIPEHIKDMTSVSTKKTTVFELQDRNYQYYSLKNSFFFGYILKEIKVFGQIRNITIAEPEKALIDFLYLYDFYRTEDDIREIRLNDLVLRGLDWNKMQNYLNRFGIKTLNNKISIIKEIYSV